MSLLFMDGFDYLAPGTAALDEKWNTARSSGFSSLDWDPTTGRFGGGAAHLEGTDDDSRLERVIAAKSTVIVGCAARIVTSEDGKFLEFGYQGNPRLHFRIEDDLTITFRKDDGTQLASSAAAGLALNENVWFHFETKLVVDGTNGSIELRVNEEEFINVTGLNTDPAGDGVVGDITFRAGAGGGGGDGYYLDDVYVLDTAGTRLNDFLGDCRIETLQPSADTAQEDFTPVSGGDNYAEVDDPERDEDSTYNHSDVVGAKDMFTMENLSTTPDTIFALQATISARKTEAGTRGLAGVLDVGGTDYSGVEHLLNEDYLYEMYIFETSPATGSPWTGSEVDGAEAGYEITS